MKTPSKTIAKYKSPELVFCIAALAGMAVVAVCILASHGELIQRYFFYNNLDTGMDFFHSIEYVRGRMPYALFDTLYPPLANVFFYLLYLLIPKEVSEKWADTFETSVSMRGTANDLRYNQAATLLFLLFLLFIIYAMYVMVDKLLGTEVWHRRAVIFCALFSYGVLYGVERGNIILLCWVFMALFLCYYKAESPVLRELAYLSLAVAAGLKLYPAFLGVLLLKDRKILPAIRTVVYGIGAVFLPLYLFNEGLLGLWMWLRVVFGFGSSTDYPWVGNGFANILAHVGHLLDKGLGTSLGELNYALFGVAVALLLLVCAFFMDKEWKTVLTLILAMGMFQSQADYIYGLYLLPLLLFVAQEKRLYHGNVLPFGIMVLFTIHLPLFHDTKSTSFTVRNLFFQVLLVILLGWCVHQTVQKIKKFAGERRPKRSPAFGHREVLATTLVALLLVVSNGAGLQIWQRIHNWGYDYVFDSGIGEEQGKTFTQQDAETGAEQEVQWCKDGAYFIIYNHSPLIRTFRISFRTGYRMDLSRPHSMYFYTGGTSYRISLDADTDEVAYDLTIHPGETRVEISYLGPKVVTMGRDGEELKMSFTVSDFQIQMVSEDS